LDINNLSALNLFAKIHKKTKMNIFSYKIKSLDIDYNQYDDYLQNKQQILTAM